MFLQPNRWGAIRQVTLFVGRRTRTTHHVETSALGCPSYSRTWSVRVSSFVGARLCSYTTGSLVHSSPGGVSRGLLAITVGTTICELKAVGMIV
jgi:hypothetical protein